MTWSCYVYYRIQPGHEAEARRRVAELLADLRERSGVAGRLLCKRGETSLWMEVYDSVADIDAFEAELEHASARTGIEAVLLPGSSRKVECFSACA